MAMNDSLKTLHTALVDASQGYSTAHSDTAKPDMKALFQAMMTLHQNAHAGEVVNDDGSFMANVHKTIISVRAAVVGLDQSSLDAFANGEEKILDLYTKAIAEAAGNPATVQMLKKYRSTLAAKIGEMRRKAA
jgi:Domain of unknown function (DUF2383)